jgi:AcrR family transcriptional regulator
MSEIARRLGMRQPSLYKYFPSLHAVYDALFARGLDRSHAAVLAAAEPQPPETPRIRAGARAWLRWAATAYPINRLGWPRRCGRAGIERQPSPSRVALPTLGARRLEIGGGMCTRPVAVGDVPRRDSLTGSQPSMLGSNGGGVPFHGSIVSYPRGIHRSGHSR